MLATEHQTKDLVISNVPSKWRHITNNVDLLRESSSNMEIFLQLGQSSRLLQLWLSLGYKQLASYEVEWSKESKERLICMGSVEKDGKLWWMAPPNYQQIPCLFSKPVSLSHTWWSCVSATNRSETNDSPRTWWWTNRWLIAFGLTLQVMGAATNQPPLQSMVGRHCAAGFASCGSLYFPCARVVSAFRTSTSP